MNRTDPAMPLAITSDVNGNLYSSEHLADRYTGISKRELASINIAASLAGAHVGKITGDSIEEITSISIEIANKLYDKLESS